MKRILVWLFFLLSTSNIVRANTTLIAYCPPASQIRLEDQASSWASKKYQGSTALYLNQQSWPLLLSGEGNSIVTLSMYAATWTDRTFLCLYYGKTANGAAETMVLATSQLDRFIISDCSFPSGWSDCEASDPASCRMTCQLK